MNPRKASIISVIMAAIGLAFTVWGMFTVSQGKVMVGVAFWAASVIVGKLVKRKLKPKS